MPKRGRAIGDTRWEERKGRGRGWGVVAIRR
jgi:hypothetical protein